jgi:hypothetical protein
VFNETDGKPMRQAIIVGGAIAFALLSGCHTAPTRSLPPAPQLLSSEPLQLPDSCVASGSVVVEFDVDASGRTGNIQVPPADACVRTALSAWVASFRYAPQAGGTQMSMEWMLVTAEKGG